MEELKKIKRVMSKLMPDAPHEVLLVLDATTGQNAIQQARQFDAAVDLTGLVITKLDGTAKGGVVIGISSELAMPVKYIGVGEQINDLQVFDDDSFVEALFGGLRTEDERTVEEDAN
jgi:fused signal recognition particle receptor